MLRPKPLWPIIGKSGGQKETKEKESQFHEGEKSLKLSQSIRQ